MNISKKSKVFIVIFTILICIIIYFFAITIYKSEKNTKEPSPTISDEKLYDLANYPKVDSSLITQNLATAFIKNFTSSDNININSLNYTDTHSAYQKLIKNDVDLIISRAPSQIDLDIAKQNNVEFELIPIVKDAIVFYVNSDNPINNLTIAQIQQIYSGEVTNWKYVGGNDEPIFAYQQPRGTDSQNEMVSLVMDNSTIINSPTETLFENSYQINNLVSNYKNSPNSIGFSYYSFANIFFQTKNQEFTDKVRLISINGISPNVETIKNGSYPFITNYYIIINKDDYSNFPSRILANQMQSARGKKIITDAGYIPVDIEEE